MDKKNKKRWLLIALVVACLCVGGLTLLGVVAGIVVPAWLSSVRAAKDAVAIRELNTFITEERVYRQEHGSYATFDQLIADGALDKRFAGESPAVEGFVFHLSVTPKSGAAQPSFRINADPLQGEGFSTTGRHHFYADSSNTTIHVSEDRPATTDDPPLEATPASQSHAR
jgi:type II secretory pathway pseudopilin PulG